MSIQGRFLQSVARSCKAATPHPDTCFACSFRERREVPGLIGRAWKTHDEYSVIPGLPVFFLHSQYHQ